jgi:2-phospho-L-lactate guanylyltransferase
MQGTVRTFSSTTSAGTVLLDDGTEIAFDHRAFDRSGLRLLRFGQRVRLETAEGPDGTPRVTSLNLVTMPL